jgi:predicted RNA-binding protein with PIN domain
MRWMVDAMNVIGSRPDGWWKDRHAAMVRLIENLERWTESTGEEVTVVFEHPPSPPIESKFVNIASARTAGPNAADLEIVRLLREDPDPPQVRVVTSDHGLADQVRSLGAEVEGAAPFRREIERE